MLLLVFACVPFRYHMHVHFYAHDATTSVCVHAYGPVNLHAHARMRLICFLVSWAVHLFFLNMVIFFLQLESKSGNTIKRSNTRGIISTCFCNQIMMDEKENVYRYE